MHLWQGSRLGELSIVSCQPESHSASDHRVEIALPPLIPEHDAKEDYDDYDNDDDDDNDNNEHHHQPGITMTATAISCEEKPRLEKVPSGVGITIGLENESGEHLPVEIDEADDDEEGVQQQQAEEPHKTDSSNVLTVDGRSSSADGEDEEIPVSKRKVSITERVLKYRNCEMQLASLHAQAEDRKKELAELLTEHAQLVHTVEVMEGDGTDKENRLEDDDTTQTKDGQTQP